MTMENIENFNWGQLQNGSDIRGVALEGVTGEPVNLTPAIVTILGQAFHPLLVTFWNQPINSIRSSCNGFVRLCW